jgi:microcystin-dependent protein
MNKLQLIKHAALGVILMTSSTLLAQIKVGDNPDTVNPASAIEVESTTKGILFPRMTAAQMNAIASPPNGLIVFNTTDSCTFYFHNTWKSACEANNINEPWYNVATNEGATENTQDIYQNGDVGIGTDNPSTALHVASTAGIRISLGSNQPSNSYDISTTTNKLKFDYVNEGRFMELTNVGGLTSSKPSGSMRVMTANQTAYPNYSFLDDVNTGISNKVSQPDELTIITAGVERLRADELGNIGIGTDNPQQKLDVNGSISSKNLTQDILHITPLGQNTDTIYIDTKIPWGNTAGKIIIDNFGYFSKEQSSFEVEFYTYTANNVYFTSPNLIKRVGDHTPNSVRLGTYTDGGSDYVRLEFTNDNKYWNSYNISFYSHANMNKTYLKDWSYTVAPMPAATTRITTVTQNGSIISDNAGNIGIGTFAPAAKLNVNGTTLIHAFSGASGLVVSRNNSLTSTTSPRLQLIPNATDNFINTVNGSLNFSTTTPSQANTKMTLLQNGNLGIGKLVPEKILHINADNDSLRFENLAGTGNALFIDKNGSIYRDTAVEDGKFTPTSVLFAGANGEISEAPDNVIYDGSYLQTKDKGVETSEINSGENRHYIRLTRYGDIHRQHLGNSSMVIRDRLAGGTNPSNISATSIGKHWFHNRQGWDGTAWVGTLSERVAVTNVSAGVIDSKWSIARTETATTEYFNVSTGNGYVGIGVNTPQEKLHVDADNDSLQFENLAGTGSTLGINAEGKVYRQDASMIGITGELKMVALSTAPTGWLVCDGSEVSRTAYATLFAAVGTAYGVGDGSTTFNLPDMRGRTPVGAGTGVGLSSRAIGDILGEETHALTEAELPEHDHDLHTSGNDDTMTDLPDGNFLGKESRGGNDYPSIYEDGAISTDKLGTGTISKTGGNTAHNVMQPSIVVNYIIKY